MPLHIFAHSYDAYRTYCKVRGLQPGMTRWVHDWPSLAGVRSLIYVSDGLGLNTYGGYVVYYVTASGGDIIYDKIANYPVSNS